jgi:hypothetical protein
LRKYENLKNKYKNIEMRKSVLFVTMTVISLLACNNTANKSESESQASTIPPTVEKFYFEFVLDGKTISINPSDITTSYNVTSKDTVFKILAGAYGSITLVVTVPHDMSRPSSTPSGSANYDLQITQGSVSLQNYPEKNLTFNSFDTGEPASAIEVLDAVVITSSEKIGKEYRIIAGTIRVKLFGGDNKLNDPAIKDRDITGKFRIQHFFNGYVF